MNAENQVQLIEWPELKLVGLYITCPFKGNNAQQIGAMKAEFNKRREEIRHVIHPERYISPHYASEVLFTYMICMEVEELADIPEGMIGFTVPSHRYASVKAKGDPYEILHSYISANGHRNNNKGLALEVYSFDNPVWPDQVEVLIPLQ